MEKHETEKDSKRGRVKHRKQAVLIEAYWTEADDRYIANLIH